MRQLVIDKIEEKIEWIEYVKQKGLKYISYYYMLNDRC